MSLSILCGLNVNLSCGLCANPFYFIHSHRYIGLWIFPVISNRWHWELRHLFCALNCAQKSWHSEHDRCWHSDLHISLYMAFVRRQGLLGHCRLFTVIFYLLQPFFVCEILQFSGHDNKTCNPWMSDRVPRVQVTQCPGSALYCQLWSQGKLQQSHHSSNSGPLLGAQSIDSSCVHRQ